MQRFTDTGRDIEPAAASSPPVDPGCGKQEVPSVNGHAVEVPAGGKVRSPSLRLVSSCSGDSSSAAGFAHAVGVTAGNHDADLVQESVQETGRGGVRGEEPTPLI